jgi:hypothetical protein
VKNAARATDEPYLFLRGADPAGYSIGRLLNSPWDAEGAEVKSYKLRESYEVAARKATTELKLKGFRLLRNEKNFVELSTPQADVIISQIRVVGPVVDDNTNAESTLVSCGTPMPRGLLTKCRLIVDDVLSKLPRR